MRAPNRVIVGLIAAAALASVSPLALAQQASPAGGPPSAEQREAWNAKADQRMHEHMEMHAKHLHDLLQLRPDQDAALRNLIAAVAPPHEPMAMDHMDPMGMHQMEMDEHHMGPGGPESMGHHMGVGPDGHDAFAKLTTPERLDKMAAMMAEHAARHQAEFQKHADAIKAFYAQLSPEQQRAFDAIPPEMLGGMHHHEGPEGEGNGPWDQMGPGGPGAPPPPQ